VRAKICAQQWRTGAAVTSRIKDKRSSFQNSVSQASPNSNDAVMHPMMLTSNDAIEKTRAIIRG
jgi:hypothetical protein